MFDGRIIFICVSVHAHRRAFDVPARVSASPRAFPRERLVFKFAFGEPEHEVVRRALVLVNFDACACLEVVYVDVREVAVVREGGDIVVEVAACHVWNCTRSAGNAAL